MQVQTIAVLILTLVGFALRLHYLTHTHPFFDEYTTVLAARQILRQGWPILPSGLFYEHGLLATYLMTPFTALFVNIPVDRWQPAHWGLMLARWPSLLIGTLTIPLVYTIGRKAISLIPHLQSPISHLPPPIPNLQSPISNPQSPISNLQSPISLVAAGLFALSPEGMVWGGRARMYALATLLVLLTVYWAYRGAVYPAAAKYRWLALLALLATLLTQFGALMLVPALVVAMVAVGWLSFQGSGFRVQGSGFRVQGSGFRVQGSGFRVQGSGFRVQGSGFRVQSSEFRVQGSHPWFLRWKILPEVLALMAVIGFAIFIKRLGRPIGFDSLSDTGSNFVSELLKTVTYQTTIHFTWADTIEFLARQFGVPHHLWLTLATMAGVAVGLIFWVRQQKPSEHQISITNHQSPHLPISPTPNPFILFLWLTFGLIILEMVTLLEPFRRNPRYIVMYLPLFYLVAGHAIFNFRYILTALAGYISHRTLHVSRITHHAPRFTSHVFTITALLLLALFTTLGFNDLRIALLTPEPAYEEAFAKIHADRQPGDIILTMNTPAAGLYLGHADGFTVQSDAEQFLLNPHTQPVDRWLGAPWLGTAADFNAALNSSPRAWFVIDTIRQPVYFRGNWQAVVNTQMEQILAHDNVLLYRTRPNRIPLPTQPHTLVNATLGDSIQLLGYTLQAPNLQSPISNLQSPVSNLHLTLFWQTHSPLPANYTVFLHLRNSSGQTVAQRDAQPLDGAYPTGHWQPGETIIHPINLPLPAGLPPGTYTLFTGLYRLDTLERLPVANDATGENAVQLGEVTLP